MQDKDSCLFEGKHSWTWPEQMAMRLSRIKTLPTTLYLLLKLRSSKGRSTIKQRGTAHVEKTGKQPRKHGRGESLNQRRYTHSRKFQAAMQMMLYRKVYRQGDVFRRCSQVKKKYFQRCAQNMIQFWPNGIKSKNLYTGVEIRMAINIAKQQAHLSGSKHNAWFYFLFFILHFVNMHQFYVLEQNTCLLSFFRSRGIKPNLQFTSPLSLNSPAVVRWGHPSRCYCLHFTSGEAGFRLAGSCLEQREPRLDLQGSLFIRRTKRTWNLRPSPPGALKSLSSPSQAEDPRPRWLSAPLSSSITIFVSCFVCPVPSRHIGGGHPSSGPQRSLQRTLFWP